MTAASQLTELRMLKRNVNFAMIPYIVNDMPLSVFSKALYLHIVRRCGASQNGSCFETTEHMAKHLDISIGSVVKAKRELLEVGLIAITKKTGKQGHGGYPNDVITVIDIEWENAFFYSTDHLSAEHREKNLDVFGKKLLKRIRKHILEEEKMLIEYIDEETNRISQS